MAESHGDDPQHLFFYIAHGDEDLIDRVLRCYGTVNVCDEVRNLARL